jgi:hypothetical protein
MFGQKIGRNVNIEARGLEGRGRVRVTLMMASSESRDVL